MIDSPMKLRTLPRRMGARGLAVALAVGSVACGSSAPPAIAPTAMGWLEFNGAWSAAGSRRALEMGAGRKAAIIDLRGSMLLAGPGRPATGFRAEVIALTDSVSGLVGRSVWTDERGDQVFSEVKGEGTAARNRITGNILGGTGRYAGATGSYEFSWQFVLEAEDGSIQGRASGLKGRVRIVQAGEEGSKP